MDFDLDNLILLTLAWLAYFGLHSLLASLWFKRWAASRWPGLAPAYRLVFNALAVVLILPVLWLTLVLRGPALWRWEGAMGWLADALALAATAGFIWSLRYYDGAEFLGLRQLRSGAGAVEDQGYLHISPMHRFVRHPWYSLALVIIWTRDMDMAFLVTACASTLYFAVGSRLEEQKLIRCHGETYRRYMACVPGLVPRPWRWLDRRSAEVLAHQAVEGRSGRGQDAE